MQPRITRRYYLLTTTATASLFLACESPSVAACNNIAETTYECGGSSGSQTVNVDNADVFAKSGLSMQADDDDDALTIIGNGEISYKDVNGVSIRSTLITDGTIQDGGALKIVSSGDAGATLGSVKIDTRAIITGSESGVVADNHGGGTIEIIADGSISGKSQAGIFVNNYAGSALTVTAGEKSSVSGHTSGISTWNWREDIGVIEVVAQGDVTGETRHGIVAQNEGTDTTITTASGSTVTGFLNGIWANNLGTGVLTITANGEVVNHNFTGINALNSGTDLTVVTGAGSNVAARDTGIASRNFGVGALNITVGGAITSEVGRGIIAENDGTELAITTVTDANVVAHIDGIVATNHGSGKIEIAADGDVSGETGAGISIFNNGDQITRLTVGKTSVVEGGAASTLAESDAGQAIKITNFGEMRNFSNRSFDQAIATAGGGTTVDNRGLLTGSTTTGDLDDSFLNFGTWNTAGSTNEFGNGSDSLINYDTGIVIGAADRANAEATVFSGLETLTNHGMITTQDGAIADRVTIDGDYIGQGGAIAIDMVLGDGGADNSLAGDAEVSDQIVVHGDAHGTTLVQVTNAGGSGALTDRNRNGRTDADEGILFAQVHGAVAQDLFQLDGPVVIGAYQYDIAAIDPSLSQSGVWDFVLASQYSNQTPIYETYPQHLLGVHTLPTLQQRVGSRYWDLDSSTSQGAMDPTKGEGATWTRIYSAHSSHVQETSTTGSQYDSRQFGLQAGADMFVHETEGGDLMVLGVTGHYGRAGTDVSSLAGDGSLDTDGYGLGLTATWYGADGVYADAQGAFTWYDSDLSSAGSGSLAEDHSAIGGAASVEIGKRLSYGNGWVVTPQAQLIYSTVSFDDFTGPTGEVVSLDKADNLRGRLGLAVERSQAWRDNADSFNRSQLYGIANLHYLIQNKSRVMVSGTPLVSEGEDLWGEVGIGFTRSWNSDHIALYGEVDFATSLANFGDDKRIAGTVGLKFTW